MTLTHFFGTALALALVLVAAHLGGIAARRLGQPAVIGQLLAGILLGPTALGAARWHLSARLFSSDTTWAVKWFGTAGLVAFAFTLGARLDRAHLPTTGRFALIAATVFGVPFLSGLGVGFALYGRHHDVGGVAIDRLPFVLFIGAAISITAFPVLARIIDDHGLAGTPIGSLAVSCAAVNDVLSWLALAVALLANRGYSGSLEVVKLAGGAAGLVAVLALVAYVADRRHRDRLASERGSPRRQWTILTIPAGLIGAAVATSQMGLHYIFGAFAFGFAVARPSLADLVAAPARVAARVATVLLPLYLVLPGVTINLRDLDLYAGREVVLVIGVAAASKLAAGALSSRAAGLSWHDAVSVGVLINTRGLVELVALAIGRSAGILDSSLYAVLVIMAVVTTVATSPGLQLLDWGGSEEARSRFRR